MTESRRHLGPGRPQSESRTIDDTRLAQGQPLGVPRPVGWVQAVVGWEPVERAVGAFSDAVGGGVGNGALQEPGDGADVIIGRDLAVDQPGMVMDQDCT